MSEEELHDNISNHFEAESEGSSGYLNLGCTCVNDDIEEPKAIPISERKLRVLSAVPRTENYLKERRIPELIRYLLAKVLAEASNKPLEYLEKLLNECMLFRAGHGTAPVIYEERHLKAVVNSFDPGQRGWMNAGQVSRAFGAIGLELDEPHEERYETDEVFKMLHNAQEDELYALLSAGYEEPKKEGYPSSTNTTETD